MFIRILALSSALLELAVPAGAQQFNHWLAPHRRIHRRHPTLENRDGQSVPRQSAASPTTTATAKVCAAARVPRAIAGPST